MSWLNHSVALYRWRSALNALVVFLAWSSIGLAGQPNFVLIIADDCTYRDMEVYGGQAKTPHLNKLASEGLKFTHCFQAAPMCSPTRHCLYTGLYPVKSGAYPNHTMAYDWVKSIAHYLQSAGYTTHLSGKTHIQPDSVFPFEHSKRTSDGNPDPDAFDSLLKSSQESKKPFLFIAASHEPHAPFTKGDPAQYPPALLQLPPVLVDAPDTREEFSKYLAEITYFDSQVGEFMALLDKHNKREETFVIVLSEQGNSFPFAKWTCYDVGLRSGCIVRWPGNAKPASTSDALVEYVDVVPTFLEAAGLMQPSNLDGRSFLNVIRGQTSQHKTHVFGLQTTRGIINGSDYYGIRSVRDAQYRYIRNLTPEMQFQNAATKDPTFKTWEKMAAAGDAVAKRLVQNYQYRPSEELYDCDADPWNQKNLADDPQFKQQLVTLRTQLDVWMKQQGDEGQPTEMKALERMPKNASSDDSPKKKAGKSKSKRQHKKSK